MNGTGASSVRDTAAHRLSDAVSICETPGLLWFAAAGRDGCVAVLET